MDLDLIAEFDRMVQLYEHSYAEHLSATGGQALPELEVRWQALRATLATSRVEVASNQVKFTELEAKLAAMDRHLDDLGRKIEAGHRHTTTGRIPFDEDGEQAALMSDGEIEALVRRLLGTPVKAAPASAADGGEVTDLTSRAWKIEDVPVPAAAGPKKTMRPPRAADQPAPRPSAPKPDAPSGDAWDLNSGDFQADE